MKILRVIFVIAVLCAPFYAQQVNSDIVPASPGLYLGHTNQRWNGYFNNADIYNLTINGSPIGTAGIGLPQISIPNGTNCTTLNGLVEFDGNGQAQTASLSSAKVIGVAVSGAGCSGNVLVQYAAIVNCTTDGSTLINDRIAASNSIAGDCMDIGPISIPGIQTVGLVTAVSSGAGQLTSFDLFTGDTISPSSSSGSGVVSVSPCVGPIGYAATAAAIVSWDCNTSLDGSGNAGFKKVTVTGSGAGKIDFSASTTPGNPAAGFFRLYANSGTGLLTCLTSTGASCLSAGAAFSAITGGTNTSAAMVVGNNASLQPLNFGRNISTGTWMYNTDPEPSTGPTWTIGTSGSILSGHNLGVEVTYNSPVGETAPSGEVGHQCGGANNCSGSVTAPTLPIGFTGYTAYARDVSNSQTMQQIAGCVNITGTCNFGSIPTTSAPPTTNALVPLPPNALTSECPPNVTPIWWLPDSAGNMHSQAYLSQFFDNAGGPPSPGGTFVECRRHWFSDNQIDPPGGKNAFVVIDHFSGVGTAATNQDRALWVDTQNPANDAATRYALEAIQSELDFNCNGCTINGSPDGEITSGSFQLTTAGASTNWTPTGYSTNAIQGRVFRNGAGMDTTGINAIYGNMANNNASGSGTLTALRGVFDGSVNDSNLTGIGLFIQGPGTTGRFGKSVGAYFTAGFTPSAFGGNSDYLIRNDKHNWNSLLNGAVGLTSIENTDGSTQALTANASMNLTGALATSQIASSWSSGFSVSCTGGASTYGYTLVAVDQNGGQVASAATSTCTTGVNPLTAPNPATLNPGGIVATSAVYRQAVRIDVYRTSGPMATGKVGSLTCNSDLPINSCNAFVDTGIAAGVALPTGNTTGTVNASGLQSPIAFTSGTLSAGVNSNVTPVTVNANVTTDQNLMAVTLPANGLNVATRNLHIFGAAVYSTPVASVATITMKVKLCTVSGCGSGTVLTPCSYTTSANPGNVTNNSANFVCDITTQTAGASAAFEAHGNLTIDLGATPGLADAVFSDTNTATVGTIDSTAQLFLQTTVSFSAASASNSMSERQQITQVTN